jgi:hypothetical protein
VCPNNRLAGYFGRQQHDKWGPMVQPVDGHDGGVEIGRATIARSAIIRSGTGRSASHERHTRPVSAEASLPRPTRAYGPVCPNKRLAGYFGRCQHAMWGLDRVAGGYG